MILRKKEILELAKVVSNGKNALIYGSLYSGKTTFLKQFISELDKEKVAYFYINCKKCFDENSFLSEYSKEGLRLLSGKVAGAVKDAYQILPNIKPVISSSSIRGAELSMSYCLTSEDINKFALDVLYAPYRISKAREEKLVVILDDYDNLLEIESLRLHEFISQAKERCVSYVLTTSILDFFSKIVEKHKEKMSLEFTHKLDEISGRQLKSFILNFFQGVVIEEGADKFLLEVLSFNLKAIMEFINYYGKNNLTIRGIKRTINSLIEKNEHFFQIFFDSLSVHQKKLIIAIAKHSGEHVFKGQFIYNNGLISVPSVQTSIKGLIKKQFLHKTNVGLQITDVFFGEWIRRTF